MSEPWFKIREGDKVRILGDGDFIKFDFLPPPRPEDQGAGYVAGSSHAERMAALDLAGIPYLTYEFLRDPAQEGW